MARDPHRNVEVAGGTAARTGRTATTEPQALPVGDAARHFDVDRLVPSTRPAPRHVGHGFGIVRPVPRALRARRRPS